MDETDLTKNEAFIVSDSNVRSHYNSELKKKSAIYFGEQPSFEDILDQINKYITHI